MQNLKEEVRNEILTKMKPHLENARLEMLDKVIVEALFKVNVVERETLPVTRDNTNEYILNIFAVKKAPKLSKETVKYYLGSVKHLLDFTGKSILDIGDMDVEFYLNWYRNIGFRGTGNSETTVNNEHRNLSAFFSWLRKAKQRMDNPVEGVERYTEMGKPIEFLTDGEMEVLRDACRIQVKAKVTNIVRYKECLRDRAMIEVFRSTAARVTEISMANLTDINWTTGEMLIYGQKNRTYRVVCLDAQAKYHLKKYVESREDDNPALFVSGKGERQRLTKGGLEAAFRTIAKRSGLNRKIYPHLFRKTTATNMAKRGCPRELIAFYLGHKNGNTKTVNKHYAATSKEQITAAFWQYGAAA